MMKPYFKDFSSTINVLYCTECTYFPLIFHIGILVVNTMIIIKQKQNQMNFLTYKCKL